MALVQFDHLPSDDVWIVDAFNRVLAGTIRGVSVSVFALVNVDPLGDPDLESPYETTTTTTTAAPTTTAVPTTSAPPSSSPPIVTTTAAPSSDPPSSSPPTSSAPTTTSPPSTSAPEPILDGVTETITVTYLVGVMVSGSVRVLTLDEGNVFATVEDATEFVTAALQ